MPPVDDDEDNNDGDGDDDEDHDHDHPLSPSVHRTLLGECQELNFAFSLDRQKVRREENCSPPNVMTDDEQNLETAFFRPESHTVVLDKYGLLRTGRITCGRTNGNGQVQHEGWMEWVYYKQHLVGEKR